MKLVVISSLDVPHSPAQFRKIALRCLLPLLYKRSGPTSMLRDSLGSFALPPVGNALRTRPALLRAPWWRLPRAGK